MIADAREAFLAACTNTSSGALSRFAREWGVNVKNKAAMAAAKERYQSLPLLLDPALRALSLRALAAARTTIVDESTPIHFTVWRGGYDVTDGADVDLTIGEFAQWLSEEAQNIAPKGEGWNVAPIRSRDGRRLNESTVSMTAVNLDCDGRGEWHRLLEVLTQLEIAFIAYQSGGYRPGKPKWHVLIFLPREFDVSTPEGEAAWKTVYTCARLVFGSVGELCGEGFDPSCGALSQPVFICERRAATDPPREVTWRRGHTVDLDALVAALPPIPLAEEHARTVRPRPDPIALDDERLERIVVELAAATSSVPSGRRSLYFSLSSALLDFGLDGDDAVRVVAQVSAAHGGDGQKHNDNVRIARYVVEKSHEEDEGASAGALAKSWPDVMEALEQALPEVAAARRAKLSERADRFIAALEARRAAKGGQAAPAGSTWSPPTTDEEIDAVRVEARAVLRRKRRRDEGNDEVHAFFLDRMVRGAAVFSSDAEAAELRIDVRKVIVSVCRVLAWHLAPTTRPEAVAAFMFPSLARTVGASDQLDEWLDGAQRVFRQGVQQRREHEAQEKAAMDARRARAAVPYTTHKGDRR